MIFLYDYLPLLSEIRFLSELVPWLGQAAQLVSYRGPVTLGLYAGVTDHRAQLLPWTLVVGTQSLMFAEHCLLSSHLYLTFVF